MTSKLRILLVFIMSVMLLTTMSVQATDESKAPNTDQKAKISLSEDMGQAMKREAAKVKEQLEQQAQSLFERKPLGWDLKTIHYLYEGALSLPAKGPGTHEVHHQAESAYGVSRFFAGVHFPHGLDLQPFGAEESFQMG